MHRMWTASRAVGQSGLCTGCGRQAAPLGRDPCGVASGEGRAAMKLGRVAGLSGLTVWSRGSGGDGLELAMPHESGCVLLGGVAVLSPS